MATPLQLEVVRKKAVLLALNQPGLKPVLDAIDDAPKEGETADETRLRFEAHRVTLDAMTAAFEVGKATAPATAGGDVADALRQNAEATRKARLADDKAAAAKEKYLKMYDETRKKTLAKHQASFRHTLDPSDPTHVDPLTTVFVAAALFGTDGDDPLEDCRTVCSLLLDRDPSDALRAVNYHRYFRQIVKLDPDMADDRYAAALESLDVPLLPAECSIKNKSLLKRAALEREAAVQGGAAPASEPVKHIRLRYKGPQAITGAGPTPFEVYTDPATGKLYVDMAPVSQAFVQYNAEIAALKQKVQDVEAAAKRGDKPSNNTRTPLVTIKRAAAWTALHEHAAHKAAAESAYTHVEGKEFGELKKMAGLDDPKPARKPAAKKAAPTFGAPAFGAGADPATGFR